MRKLADIKNRILANHIHMEERYPKLLELTNEVASGIQCRNFRDQSCLALFEQIALQIEKLKELILLSAEMKKSGYIFTGISASENQDYYEECFDRFIKEGKSTLKKLRPFILDYLRDWNPEQKARLTANQQTGAYFRTWLT